MLYNWRREFECAKVKSRESTELTRINLPAYVNILLIPIILLSILFIVGIYSLIVGLVVPRGSQIGKRHEAYYAAH